jgi:hypothetical protein
MDQFEIFWERASRVVRNKIAKFVQKKTEEAEKRRVDELLVTEALRGAATIEQPANRRRAAAAS